MWEIFDILKECLGLVLLTGALTGLLYAVAKARETWKPEVKALTEEIAHAKEERKALQEHIQTLREQTEAEEKQIEEQTEQIEALEEAVKKAEKMRSALMAQNEEIRRTYATTHSMLSTQQERLAQLQEEIGNDSVTALLEAEEQRTTLKNSLKSRLKESIEAAEEALMRSRRIAAQKEEQEAHRNRVAQVLHELGEKLSQKRAVAETLEADLEAKIASLEEASRHWTERIRTFREKLLSLKESR